MNNGIDSYSRNAEERKPLDASAKTEGLEPAPDPPPEREGVQARRTPRGFARMDRKLVSEIASKGGKAAHACGTAHEFTSDEARVAGRKGGQATHAKRRNALER